MNHPRGSCFRPRPTALAGFLIATLGASVGGWNLKGFCWGVWISALATSLAAVVVSAIRALFVRPAAVRRFFDSSAWFRREIAPLPTPILWAMQAGAATLFAFIMVRVILFLFGFYGVFLSFFAESEPVELFGRNGFVNSDFITPTLFLLGRYWPMVVGGALTDLGPVFRVSPWRGFVRPFSQALAPLHVFVLLMPFVALLFFLLFGEKGYEVPAVIALIALYQFYPRRSSEGDSESGGRMGEGESERRVAKGLCD